MIAHLRGELARVETDYVVIDVQGVGYRVYPPPSVAARMPGVGETVTLLVSTVVRADSITLYGFADESQQSMFELLLTVSGVGPKVALNILSLLPVEDIIGSISSESFTELNRVPGVGTKTAQRIVLELREKAAALGWAQAARKEGPAAQRVLEDAVEGLVALGYNRADARAAVEEAAKSMDDDGRDTGAVVRAALRMLSGG